MAYFDPSAADKIVSDMMQRERRRIMESGVADVIELLIRRLVRLQAGPPSIGHDSCTEITREVADLLKSRVREYREANDEHFRRLNEADLNDDET